MFRSHYDVLGVPPSATIDDIRQSIDQRKETGVVLPEELAATLLDELARARYDVALFSSLPRPQVENADLAASTFVTIMLTAGVCPVPRAWSIDRKLAVCWYALGVMESCSQHFTKLSLQHAPATLALLRGFLSIILKIDDDLIDVFASVLEKSAPAPDDDYVIGLGATIANSHIRDREPPDAGIFKTYLMRTFST